MTFNLPIYHTIHRKKGDKTILVGMNWYRRAHHQEQHQVEQRYYDLVIWKVQKQKPKKPLTNYRIHYKLFYKNKSCDMMNVVAAIDKFVNDGLIKAGAIVDDNVGIYRKMSAEVAGQDRDFPRIEISIEEMT